MVAACDNVVVFYASICYFFIENIAIDISQNGKYNPYSCFHQNISLFMRILGLLLLEAFKNEHANSRGQLDAWRMEVEQENWETPQDIKRRYPSADFLPDNRIIFNIKGNSYRLVVKVRYQNRIIIVEWIGTHAEYSKKKF